MVSGVGVIGKQCVGEDLALLGPFVCSALEIGQMRGEAPIITNQIIIDSSVLAIGDKGPSPENSRYARTQNSGFGNRHPSTR